METDPRITLDLGFWGIHLCEPNKVLTAPSWSFERTHAVTCAIVALAGVEVAETFLGVVIPSTLRERENVAQIAKAPEGLQPEIRMHTAGSRWADVRVALEGRLPNIREAISKVVAVLAQPTLMPTVLGEMMVAQGKDNLPTPILHQGKLMRGIFKRPQDVYCAVLACTMENLFPLDDGGIARSKLAAKPPRSFAPFLHWSAYNALYNTDQSESPTPPAA